MEAGDGWCYVEGNEKSGYVPSSYLKIVEYKEEGERFMGFAEAMYRYVAQRGDELSFEADDVIMIEEDGYDPDWFKGQIGQRKGYVPSMYLRIISKVFKK